MTGYRQQKPRIGLTKCPDLVDHYNPAATHHHRTHQQLCQQDTQQGQTAPDQVIAGQPLTQQGDGKASRHHRQQVHKDGGTVGTEQGDTLHPEPG